MLAALRDRPSTTAEFGKAWKTTANRIAAAQCITPAGQTLCAVSLHCSRSDGTSEFLGTLKSVLTTVVAADLYVVGMDSNVSFEESQDFQAELRKLKVEFA